MPRPAKGARLYLQPETVRADRGIVEPASWLIRDGRVRHRTGILGSDARDASDPRLQAALKDYLAERHDPAPGPRHPSQIPVADVLNLYVRRAVSAIADAGQRKEAARRIKVLSVWWKGKTLSGVNGESCRDYVEGRPQQAARRELEDLRAAINLHRKEGKCSEFVGVVLPDRAQSRDRWLTRSEAAALIWSAWRYREVQKGKPTGRRSRRHVARFILIAIYTGSRSGVICAAATRPGEEGRGFVDYERGVFYRRGGGVKETKKRAPPIRLPDRLLAHMRRWRRLGISRNAVIEWNGGPVTSIKKALAKTAQAAGVEGVSPHVFRHTTATWGLQNSADIWELSGYLGMTPEMLMRVYGHHHPDHQRGAGEAVTARNRQLSGRNEENGNGLSATQRRKSRVISMQAK